MRWIAALLFVSSVMLRPPLALAGDPGSDADYIGGTLANLPGRSEGKIDITDQDAFLFRAKQSTVRIPYDKITTVEYGQRVGRRYVSAILISPVMLLAKSRKHFLTVGYTDSEGRGQAMIFRIGKNSVRALLAGLEARTGRRVEFQDEEARKAGKG